MVTLWTSLASTQRNMSVRYLSLSQVFIFNSASLIKYQRKNGKFLHSLFCIHGYKIKPTARETYGMHVLWSTSSQRILGNLWSQFHLVGRNIWNNHKMSWSYCSFSALISEVMLYFTLWVLSIRSDPYQELQMIKHNDTESGQQTFTLKKLWKLQGNVYKNKY